MGLNQYITIERHNGEVEVLVEMRKMYEIKEFMKTLGITVYNSKMITPKILEEIVLLMKYETNDRVNDYIDDITSDEQSMNYKMAVIYDSTTNDLIRALDYVKETRKLGERIMYFSEE